MKKIKKENATNRVKIRTIKSISKQNIYNTYHLHLQRQLESGKKESRKTGLNLVDNLISMPKNQRNYEIASAMRTELEQKLSMENLEGKSVSILSKIQTRNFIDYFEKIGKEKPKQPNHGICLNHFKVFIKKDRIDIKILIMNSVGTLSLFCEVLVSVIDLSIIILYVSKQHLIQQ